jgi:hypothetical protein
VQNSTAGKGERVDAVSVNHRQFQITIKRRAYMGCQSTRGLFRLCASAMISHHSYVVGIERPLQIQVIDVSAEEGEARQSEK